MTVATAYHNFQRDGGGNPAAAYLIWNEKDWDHKQPGMKSLFDFCLKRWGGSSLGSYGRRPIRHGSQPSSHGTGGTFDWSYKRQGTPDPAWLDECFDFLIGWSAELGIQMIAHYYGCRIWKADRSGDVNGGWKTQNPSTSGMGQPWAGWLHIETHPSEFDDGRSVEEKIGLQNVPPAAPSAGQFGLWPLNPKKPTLRYGSKGEAVKYLQGVLKTKASQTWIKVDGGFGNITQQSVLNVQQIAGITRDGVVGPQTWKVIDRLALT